MKIYIPVLMDYAGLGMAEEDFGDAWLLMVDAANQLREMARTNRDAARLTIVTDEETDYCHVQWGEDWVGWIMEFDVKKGQA